MPREDQRGTQRAQVVQLSERRRRVGIRTAHCGRCKRRVPVRRPWRGYRHLRLLWFGVLLGLLPLLPAMALDACVLMPALLLLLLAIGPLHALARTRPSCRRCGADLGPPRPGADGAAEVIPLQARRRRHHRSMP